MRDWPGRRDDLSDVSDEGLMTAQNVSYKVAGELRRRPGLDGDDRIDDGGDLITEWSDPYGTAYFAISYHGDVELYRISDGVIHQSIGSYKYPARGCFAKSNGRLYFTNDFNPMGRVSSFDAGANEVAGIVAPAAAIGTPTTATGLCTAGTHGMRYRYFDSKSLYMSDPSDQTNITLTGPSALTFSIFTSGTTIIRSTDTKVDQIIIELTQAGSSTFYRAATVNQTVTGTTISMADSTLRLQTTAARDGDFGHQPPPLATMIVEHRARLFAFGASVAVVTGITVTSGSTVITTAGSTISSGWAGRLIKFGSDNKLYRFASIQGSTQATMSEVYSGTSATISGAQVVSATPDMLYWSRAGFPESWNTATFARRVLQNTPDAPSGMVSHHEVLYLFGQRTMRMLDYSSDPGSGQLVTIPTDMGLWNQRCLIECGGRVFGWGRSGVWTINGLIPTHLSRPIDGHIDGSDPTSADIYDVSQFQEFHGVYDPRERCLMWFYCTSSDTKPKHAIVYDLDTQKWSISTFSLYGIVCSCLSSGGDRYGTRAVVTDELGYSWYLSPDHFDGVPSILSGGVVTVGGTGSTATDFDTFESLPTGTGQLFGAIATYSSQQSDIASNTSNHITLSVPLSSPPTNGSEVYIGQIAFTMRTKWTVIDGAQNKKRPAYLMLALVPGTSTGKLTVKIYLDFSTSPFVYTKGSADTDLDGVTVTNGSASISVDLDGGSGDGVAFIPLPYDWHRSISAEIISTRPQNLLKILDYQWLFKDQRSTVPVEDE